MSREVKRVALDFDWPINKTWQGYINPFAVECLTCQGSGETISSQRLDDLISLLMLSADDSQRGRCHPYFKDIPLHRTENLICGKDMVELTTGLAGRAPSFMGHDAIDRFSAKEKIIDAALLPKTWGECPNCNGTGIRKDMKIQYENWEKTEPPTGEGWQMWETVSEGSPLSPVFDTPEKLAQWLADTKASASGSMTATYKQWLGMIKKGWAPSMTLEESSEGKRIISGVEFISEEKKS